jgi:hypothetical protein
MSTIFWPESPFPSIGLIHHKLIILLRDHVSDAGLVARRDFERIARA